MLSHKLAARGGRTVRELMWSMDAGEWVYWQAFDELSPIGDERGDRHAALVAWVLANQWRSKEDRPIGQEDFIPDYGGMRAEIERRRMKSKKYRAKLLRQARERFMKHAEAGSGSANRTPDAQDRR